MAKSGTPDFRKIQRKRKQRQQMLRRENKKMLQRLSKTGLGKHKIVRDPKAVKMSEVLLDFIEPYRYVTDSEESIRKLVTTALIAWNTALLPEEEQKESLQKIAETLPDEVTEDFYAIIKELIERKNNYFAEYTRHILDYELTDLGDDYHISVISTIEMEPEEESGK